MNSINEEKLIERADELRKLTEEAQEKLNDPEVIFDLPDFSSFKVKVKEMNRKDLNKYRDVIAVRFQTGLNKSIRLRNPGPLLTESLPFLVYYGAKNIAIIAPYAIGKGVNKTVSYVEKKKLTKVLAEHCKELVVKQNMIIKLLNEKVNFLSENLDAEASLIEQYKSDIAELTSLIDRIDKFKKDIE